MIKNIEHIIESENENICLDFKKIQYIKEKYGDFLKDVIAMANVIAEGDKLIVIGVKHFTDGRREIHPIKNSDFVDSATYQQLIRENIEPDLHIEYDAYPYKEGLIGVFHLPDCNNPPYLLKKDFRTLKQGDCFIRKGSHQPRVNRGDLDKIYKRSKFLGIIDIGFANTNYAQEIELSIVSLDDLPSQKAADKLREILNNREKSKKNIDNQRKTVEVNLPIFSLPIFPVENIPYEKRSTETLEKNLVSVKEDYGKDDQYEVMEVRAFRLNFEIFNNGDEYLQDASIRIEIPQNNSYIIAEDIMEEPNDNSFIKIHAIKTPYGSHYPNVEYNENKILVHENIGNIKHQMITKVFDCDIRLAVIEIPEDGVIPIDFKLFGKNLPNPIHKKLTIKVL